MTEGNWQHEQWRKALKERRAKQKRRESVIKKVLAGAALVGAAIIFTGFYDGDQRLVTETYTVKEGDTLWSIATEYLKKNTGGRRYILEFKQGIIENNPELQNGNAGHIRPGQEIIINYFVKEEKEQ
ncbi:LysM peptidoglycan-binding domain-containing protein [Selenomonas ruminantium]|uniref:LysM domain-containing protein n=1 Tax=Selenomonas ruminantium TaxID=971 RepID=A0A1H0MYD0_SELRU|nr:LysM domain-containing protein [Selenomonas ruminantium]SDO85423.1 LysM domain-containing protein [Selenomonas ruminantium]